MYELVRSYARRRRRSDRWVETGLSDVPLKTLSTVYDGVCFIITYPALQGGERALYLRDIAVLIKDALNSDTIQDWLTKQGNKSLPVKEDIPTFKPKYVRYINAWYGNYQLDPMGPSRRLEPDKSKYDKDDVFIRHDKLDGPTLRKQAMVSVNGFFHFAEYMPDGILVHHANRSILKANHNQIGIHSFRDVGEINYIPVTDEMIFNQSSGDPLSDGVYVDLPGVPTDYKDKTILFVFNGYLHTLGNGYRRVGEKTFRLELSRQMMLERYYQSREFMDMDDIPLTKYQGDDNLVSVNEFHRDEVIRWFLNRSQTFFVVVDVASMFSELEPVENVKLPGRFMDFQNSDFPLVGVYGKGLEYRALRYPGDKNVMATIPNERHRFDFHTYPWKEQPGVNSGRSSEKPFTHDHAYWRLLGTQE